MIPDLWADFLQAQDYCGVPHTTGMEGARSALMSHRDLAVMGSPALRTGRGMGQAAASTGDGGVLGSRAGSTHGKMLMVKGCSWSCSPGLVGPVLPRKRVE